MENVHTNFDYPTLDPKNTVQGWYFTDAEIATATRAENPQMLQATLYFPTGKFSGGECKKCNLGCIDCYTEAKDKAKRRNIEGPLRDVLSLTEYYQTIDNCKRLGTKTVNLVGEGEPTLYPYFREIVRYIHQQNMIPLVATNGITLTEQPDLADFLYEHNVTIAIKIRSFDKKFQDVIVKRRWYADDRDKALSLLIEKGFNVPTPTRLMANILANNYTEDILNIYRWCRERNIIPEVADYLEMGQTEGGKLKDFSAIKNNLNLTPTEKETYLQRLQPLDHDQKVRLMQGAIAIDKEFWIERNINVPCAYYNGMPCTQWMWVLIDERGYLYHCVGTEKVIGHIQETTLEELYHTMEMRENVKNLKGCPYKEFFRSKQ